MRTRFFSFVFALAVATSAMAQVAQVAPRANATREQARPHYKVGLENLRAEHWEEAAAAFQRAADIDSKWDMAYYGLGRALMPMKRFAEAAAAFLHCRDLYTADSGKLFANKQDAQRWRKDRLMDISELIREWQSGPQTAQAQDRVRQLNERKRQLEEDIQRGNDLSMDASVPAFVSISLGSAFFRLGRLEDAEREYKATIQADNKSGEAYSNLAVLYMETGRLDEADKMVHAAEKVGFNVHPQLKADIQARRKAGLN
jgi:tetratricopeptide (TPR) repeat protein